MPAVDLVHLRKQTAHLLERFDDPEAFVRALHEVLDFYTNHTRRTAGQGIPAFTLRSYRTPPAVLRHLQTHLASLAESRPLLALDLADRLWQEDWLEMKLLAAVVLGHLPPREEHLFPRLMTWSQQGRDARVRAALLSTGLQRLRRESPERFLLLVGEWLHPERPRLWSMGIQALLPLLRDPDFHNLPPVFAMLQPLIQAAPISVQGDLLDLLQALYQVSPLETIHFLRQILQAPSAPAAVLMLRRLSPALPPDLVAALRDLLPSSPTS